jgi:hypothetical protein
MEFNLKTKSAIVILVLAASLFTGCATSGKINAVSAGMTKKQVIEAMGDPDSVSAQGEAEYLSYFLCYSNCAALIVENRGRDWYYVRLVNGVVESYGKKGDFDSTKTPTTRIERVDTLNQDIKVKDSRTANEDRYSELTKLKSLLNAGVITKAEFDDQKKRILAR